MKRRDRIIGILLGLVLGVGIVTAFVFLGANQTIDSALLGGGGGSSTGNGGGSRSRVTPVQTVHVIGGAPPTKTGAPTFQYHQGDQVRLQVVSDITETVELVGYGISKTVPVNTPTMIDFTASKCGNYPLILTTHISVAAIRVLGPGGSLICKAGGGSGGGGSGGGGRVLGPPG